MRSHLTMRLALIAVLAVLSSGAVALGQPSTSSQDLVIDAKAPAHLFPHFWEEMFGSGRAILSLREDYRQDLRRVKDATGFTYIRFHDILDDDIGIYDEDSQGHPVYNFLYADQIYD